MSILLCNLPPKILRGAASAVDRFAASPYAPSQHKEALLKNWIIGGLVVALAVSIGAGVLAQSQRTANVEVRVWEDVNDPERNFISARPEGGSWRTLGTIPIPLTDGVSSSGRFRYGDITLAVPLPDAPGAPTATPTPTPAPTEATTATVSGTGPTVGRISLGEGTHVCEVSIQNNLATRGSDGILYFRLVNRETGDERTLASDYSDNGSGKWTTLLSATRGVHLVEVTEVESTSSWAVRCLSEEKWFDEWSDSGGRAGHGNGSTISLFEIKREGVHTCTATISDNIHSAGTARSFSANIPVLRLTPLVSFGRGESGTWERVLNFPRTGLHYVHARGVAQSAQWSFICE